MKTVKIALSAVAVFAVVGGALAFKANNATQKIYIHDTKDTRPFACTQPSLTRTLEPIGAFVTNTLATLTPVTANCTLVDVYVGE